MPLFVESEESVLKIKHILANNSNPNNDSNANLREPELLLGLTVRYFPELESFLFKRNFAFFGFRYLRLELVFILSMILLSFREFSMGAIEISLTALNSPQLFKCSFSRRKKFHTNRLLGEKTSVNYQILSSITGRVPAVLISRRLYLREVYPLQRATPIESTRSAESSLRLLRNNNSLATNRRSLREGTGILWTET